MSSDGRYLYQPIASQAYDYPSYASHQGPPPSAYDSAPTSASSNPSSNPTLVQRPIRPPASSSQSHSPPLHYPPNLSYPSQQQPQPQHYSQSGHYLPPSSQPQPPAQQWTNESWHYNQQPYPPPPPVDPPFTSGPGRPEFSSTRQEFASTRQEYSTTASSRPDFSSTRSEFNGPSRSEFAASSRPEFSTSNRPEYSSSTRPEFVTSNRPDFNASNRTDFSSSNRSEFSGPGRPEFPPNATSPRGYNHERRIDERQDVRMDERHQHSASSMAPRLDDRQHARTDEQPRQSMRMDERERPVSSTHTPIPQPQVQSRQPSQGHIPLQRRHEKESPPSVSPGIPMGLDFLKLRDSYRTVMDASEALGGGHTAEMLERMIQSASYGAQMLEAAATRHGQLPSHSIHGHTHPTHGQVPPHGLHSQTHAAQVHGPTHSVQSATPSPQQASEPEEAVKEVHVEGTPNKRQKMEDGVQEGQTCLGCSATSTPEWRRGPMGPRTLCNACGLVYAKLIKKRARERNGTIKKPNGDAGSEEVDTEEDDDSASQDRRSEGIDRD